MSFAPLLPSEMPPAPWDSVSGDLYGPMDDGFYWFVNYCEYSKWASVERVSSTSSDAIEPILENLFDHFGVPVEYKTDNGSPFQSQRFAAFALEKGFKHRKVTPEWPRANGGAESFMKKLGKVVRIAKMTNLDKYVLIKDFLRRYRETPHSTTKVAPALLLLGYSRSSGIPQLVQPFTTLNLIDIHAYAKRNHDMATARMKLEYDNRMRVTKSNIDIGSLVLIKLKKERKSTPIWDPDPYRVIAINGSQITASRHDRTTSRNSSFFKLFRYNDDEDLVEHTAPLRKPSIVTSTDTESTSNPVSPKSAQASNFVEPGEELNTAIQRQVSFNDEIVVINSNVDNEIEPLVEPSPVITPAPIIAPKPNKPTAKLGRPTKEESDIKEQNRIMLEQERRANNPPPRASSRIATQNPRGGKM
jgi:glycogen debranching enzyme